MLYRKLDANGDYTFGRGANNFYKDIPAAVAQAVKTNLGLVQGEWFLDTTVGTPYTSKILGAGKAATYDAAIRSVILNTPGVKSIVSYSSGINQNDRSANVTCLIDTIYGIIGMTGQMKYSAPYVWANVGR